jgi:ankyrin repeat protein
MNTSADIYSIEFLNACREGRIRKAIFLLAAGANPCYVDKDGNNAYHYAAGNKEVLNFLEGLCETK